MFTINDVEIKVLGKLKMTQNMVLLNIAKLCLNIWPLLFRTKFFSLILDLMATC